jgi:pimeloyl-ACP methyl ester carboxylesterase
LGEHAQWVLPVVLAEALAQLPEAQRPNSKPNLFGHSDGGSIALLFAAHYPRELTAAIVLAPHIMVEPISLVSIRAARIAYQNTELRQRLARYHQDVDSAFYGWNDVWLSPQFESWNITGQLSAISQPILAIQGLQDEYGTLEQIRGIAKVVQHTQLLELDNCGHSAHKDQPEAVFSACKQFIV